MASIDFKNVTKSFDGTKVIDGVNLHIEDGSFSVLVGPSGCGKTTLLRMIAGIGPQTSGEVWIDGRDVSKILPGDRGVAMVFQNYAIYPTMSVWDNIDFGLKNNRISKEERKKIIEDVSEKVGLTPYLNRKPSTLSGGQRQRIALARAMSKKPKVFLMDEPLSNLDAKLRQSMRLELIRLHKKLKTTFVYVTHDQVEAMSMADTIILMNKGKIQQEATPEQIYCNPANLFTAQFIGSPSMNIIEVPGERKWGFRPEKVRLSDRGLACPYSVNGIIRTREMLGRETIYSIEDCHGNMIMAASSDGSYKPEQRIYASVDQEDLYIFGKDGDRIYE